MAEWLQQEVGVTQWIVTFINPFGTINIMALIISAVSTALLLDGVEPSKTVTNWMTTIKVAFVVFMGLGGIELFQGKNGNLLSLHRLGVQEPLLGRRFVHLVT
jgi:amino acid transporter